MATDFSSSSYTVKDPIISVGSPTGSSSSFKLNQSLSQVAPGKSTSSGFGILSGFQYYFTAQSNTLTATAGDGQVSLSWTVPQTYLGVGISGYEVGTGTTSGAYTFENVGNITNFVKTGLVNGTTYYFKIKTKTSGGLFLVYSNEATAVPTGSVTPPGGGSGGQTYSEITVIGYPSGKIVVLKNGAIDQEIQLGQNGQSKVVVSSGGVYSVYGKDSLGLSSPPVILTGTQTVFVPPTISVTEQKKQIFIQGTTQGQSQINIRITGPDGFNKTEGLTSNADGRYNFSLDTTDLKDGKYDTWSVGPNAQKSRTISFILNNGKIEIPTPVACGDFNKDGRVNLIDFSILLYWYDSPNPPARVDCNRDNKIDLVDFSILMYEWTG